MDNLNSQFCCIRLKCSVTDEFCQKRKKEYRGCHKCLKESGVFTFNHINRLKRQGKFLSLKEKFEVLSIGQSSYVNTHELKYNMKSLYGKVGEVAAFLGIKVSCKKNGENQLIVTRIT